MKGTEIQKQGQVVIITGAARGIGRAISERLANDGHHLALNDIDGEALTAALAQIKEAGHQVLGIAGDVSDPDTSVAMVGRVMEQFGCIDSLVNNAGIGGVGKSILELTLDEWEEMLRIDLTSTFLLCRAVLPHMISQQRGRIVNISSITAMMGVAGSTHYAAAKAGVIGFSKSLAREVADKRINVNVVAPGLIDTAMSRKRGIDHQRHLVAWPRIGQPADIAGVVAFLLSDAAEFITGQVISPSGGAYM
ncbi:MAG: SDR family oxidoreductase [Desulfobacterales bacterium]|nr:MAG: SDR family oxidoreductase [Desulfobacterales bacterium]